MLGAVDVLDEARRRAAALRDPYERACAREVLAAAALAVLGAKAASADAKRTSSLARLGRTAAELRLGASELVALLDRSGAETKTRAGALANACGAFIDRGDRDAAAALLGPLRELDEAVHDLYADALASACLACGDRAAALAAVMRIKRPKDAASSYVGLVESACRAGDLEEARKLVTRIKDKVWRPIADRVVALAAVRAGSSLDAEPLVATLEARELAVMLGELLGGWIADDRIEEAMTALAAYRARLGEHAGRACAPIIGALAARGAWGRAEALVGELGRDLDAHRAWTRALAAAGRDDDARAWIARTGLRLEPQVALGMADRGDLDDAIRSLGSKPGVLPNAIEEAIDAHLARLDPRGGVQWLLRVAPDPGRILNIVTASGDPSLFDEVASAFAEPPFTANWLVLLLEAGAWSALAADDPARARVRLHAVVTRDPGRASYVALAFGQLAAASIARGEASTISAVDAILQPLENPLHRAQAFAEAARAFGLRGHGILTDLKQ